MALARMTLMFAGTLAAAAVAHGSDTFRLAAPELLETPRRASNLTVADFDRDGRPDIAVVSNDEAVLRVWHALDKPAEDGTLRRREQYTLDRMVTDMAAVDADGDGRTDIVLASGSAPLLVMRQNDDGRLQKGRELAFKGERLCVGDLTADGRDDMLVVRGRRLDVARATADGFDSEPAATMFATTNLPARPLILDLDGDGRNDIAYASTDQRDRLTLRFQTAEGAFPHEIALKTGVVRDLAVIRRAQGADSLAMIHGTTRELVALALSEPVEEGDSGDPSLGDPRYIGFDPERRDENVVAAVADIDGDGLQDLVCALPGSATMRVLRGTKSGNLDPREMATLKGIRQVVPFPARKGEATPVLVVSGDEKAVAVAMPKDDGSFEFPRPLPVAGTPLAAALVAGDGKGAVDLLVAVEGSDGKRTLARHRGFDPEAGTLAAPVQAFDFAGAKEPARGLEAMDANRDGREDLIVFFEFARPIVLVQGNDGTFMEAGTGGMIDGMLKGILPRSIGSVRLDGESGDDAMIVREEYARAFRLGADGQVVVSRQFAGAAGRSRLRAAATGHLRSDSRVDVALLDAGTRTLAIHGRRDGGSDYEELATVELDAADYQWLRCFDVDGDGRDDVVAVAPDRVAVVPARAAHGALDTVDSFKTAVEDGGFGGVFGLPLRDRDTSVIVAVELKENRLEFFDLEKEKEDGESLVPFYHFRVFDSEASLARRTNLDAPPEPRELRAADMDNDGRADLVALANDYVIVYRRTD